LVGSFILSEVAAQIKPSQSFFFFPTRAWELLIGALCAFALNSSHIKNRISALPKSVLNILSFSGLTAIVVTFFVYGDDTIFPSYATLLPVLGTAFVIMFATEQTAVSKLLSVRILVGVGIISYSIYLWHHPLFAFAKVYADRDPSLSMMLLLSLISVFLAAVTWKYIEQPFRVGHTHQPVLRRQGAVFAAAGAGIAFFVAFGVWGLESDGREEWWARNADANELRTFTVLKESRSAVAAITEGECRFSTLELTTEAKEKFISCAQKFGSGTVILGDSHAANLITALQIADTAPFLVGVIRGGCRPGSVDPDCAFYNDLRDFLRDVPGVFEHVVFENAGQHILFDSTGRTAERLFARLGPEGEMDPQDISIDLSVLDGFADYVKSLAEFTRVTWLTPRMEFHFSDTYIIKNGCDFSFALRPGQAQIFEMIAQSIQGLVAGTSNISVVDQGQALALQMPEDFMTCERSFWSDGDHLSAHGATAFGQRLAPILLGAN
jgi:hypothetical protein